MIRTMAAIAPMIRDALAQLFALFDAACASAYRPLAQRLSTFEAFIRAITPPMQQNSSEIADLMT